MATDSTPLLRLHAPRRSEQTLTEAVRCMTTAARPWGFLVFPELALRNTKKGSLRIVVLPPGATPLMHQVQRLWAMWALYGSGVAMLGFFLSWSLLAVPLLGDLTIGGACFGLGRIALELVIRHGGELPRITAVALEVHRGHLTVRQEGVDAFEQLAVELEELDRRRRVDDLDPFEYALIWGSIYNRMGERRV
jgi:hypothetical protein